MTFPETNGKLLNVKCSNQISKEGHPAMKIIYEKEEIDGEAVQNVVIFYKFAGKIEWMVAASVVLVILDLNELSKKSGMNLWNEPKSEESWNKLLDNTWGF